MSYSVNQRCGACKKQADCADGVIIMTAVQSIIHAWAYRKAHLGSGSVTHDCQNFEDKGNPTEGAQPQVEA
jgi:hypothetical protein